jgi:LAO/AO transport system kinase
MSRAARLPAAARAVVGGDRRALARLITAVENHDPAALPVLRALYQRTGKARVIGLTGPLGVGKSSIINGLLALLRGRGLKVGVIAVDPSSPFSGGSVLGDRVRLERQVGDEGVFIRSMASRGHTGGVAATTREVCRLLDAFGLEVILVETVGSGQVDVEIREVATTSVVVLVPHLGDEVQSLKAGLFEIADVFCVNKADLAGADLAAKDLSELVSLGANPEGWRPAVVTTSTQTGVGLDVLWSAIDAHEQFLDTKDLRRAGERRRLAREIVGLVRERVGRELTEALDRDPDLTKVLDALVARTTDPYEAADRLYRDTRRKG